MHIKVSANFFAEEPGASLSSDAQLLYLKFVTFQWTHHLIQNDWTWIEEHGLVIKNKHGVTLFGRTSQAVRELIDTGLVHIGTPTAGTVFAIVDQDAVRVNPLRCLKGGRL
jgi:hypothetical protein